MTVTKDWQRTRLCYSRKYQFQYYYLHQLSNLEWDHVKILIKAINLIGKNLLSGSAATGTGGMVGHTISWWWKVELSPPPEAMLTIVAQQRIKGNTAKKEELSIEQCFKWIDVFQWLHRVLNGGNDKQEAIITKKILQTQGPRITRSKEKEELSIEQCSKSEGME